MENLATVMTLYSRRTFSKESFQWTKCVVKYLHDSYGYLTLPMVTFLVEVKFDRYSVVVDTLLTMGIFDRYWNVDQTVCKVPF